MTHWPHCGGTDGRPGASVNKLLVGNTVGSELLPYRVSRGRADWIRTSDPLIPDRREINPRDRPLGSVDAYPPVVLLEGVSAVDGHIRLSLVTLARNGCGAGSHPRECECSPVVTVIDG
jgi:hypothetical protein